ncbi:MAG: hypothetical protein JJ979_14150 [Roseibium sp.]|nr:hypothetical protein [Roseibium sp.]
MHDRKIRTNVILFFVAASVCLLSMLFVSRADIDEYVKLVSVVSMVGVFFFVGLYFAVRIFYLCFKKS